MNEDRLQLLDENEQLRTALESAVEDNNRLVEEIEQLQRRARLLSSELHAARAVPPAPIPVAPPPPLRPSEAEEELRVAFEELQVLTEELEIANTSLHETNQELDARVEERTRQLGENNRALRSAENSLRTIADLVPDLLWRTTAEGEADWFNQRWFEYTGQEHSAPLGRGWLDALHPVDRDNARAGWSRAVARGTAFEQETRIRDDRGNYRWFLVRAEPLSDEYGRITRWFAAGTDVHDQRTAMEALQKSELRFRTLIEGMPQLVWRAIDGGQWTWSSPQWSDYTGQSEAASRAHGWLDAFHPDDRPLAETAWAMAHAAGILEIEGRILHADEQRYRHFRTRALPVRDAEGRTLEWLGTSTDVDDILQLQRQQEVLVAELQHRTRNLMAVVQSITTRTLRGSTDLQQFRQCIDDRLSALARVQGLLSRRESGLRVSFDTLIREELGAHVELCENGCSPQVTTEGPSGVPLRSTLVQTLALALHELATNAVKYGALSTPEGHLSVTWQVEEKDDAERLLHIDWRETGVADLPDANARARGSGYGRELIERALPYQLGARTRYAFEPDGVHCTIDVTVPVDETRMETSHG
jgi:two-component system CheB/CheR fusion protein